MIEPQEGDSSLPQPLSGLEVLWRPIPAMRRLVADRSLLPALVVVALSAAVNVAAALLAALTLSRSFTPALFPQTPPAQYEQLRQMMPLMFSLLPVAGLVAPFVLWLLLAGVLHLVSSAFGGRGPFRGTLLITGVASAANIVGSATQTVSSGLQYALGPSSAAATALGGISSLLGLAALVWFAILVVIGLQEARTLSQGGAIGTCGVSCAGCTLLPVLLMCLLIVFGAVVGGVMSGAAAP